MCTKHSSALCLTLLVIALGSLFSFPLRRNVRSRVDKHDHKSRRLIRGFRYIPQSRSRGSSSMMAMMGSNKLFLHPQSPRQRPYIVRPTLLAEITRYPGFQGETAPHGFVHVIHQRSAGTTSLKFLFHLIDLPANCTSCGAHIHTGVTCDNATEVGGHYWREFDDTVSEDPWIPKYGAVYNSDKTGHAAGDFKLHCGYGFRDSLDHAVVFHAQDGSRIGCGILKLFWGDFNPW